MAHELAWSSRTNKVRMGSTQQEWHFNETQHILWSSPPTIQQVIEDLDFETDVLIRPIFDMDRKVITELRECWRPSYSPNGNLAIDDHGAPLGTRLGLVGPRFTPIQDRDFIGWFSPWLESTAVEIQTCGAIFHGARVFATAKINRDMVEIRKDDPVAAYVNIYNGHDGAISFKAFPSNIRQRCNNSVQIALKNTTFRKFSVKHNTNVKERIETIREALVEAEGMFLSEVEKFKWLDSKKVKDKGDLKKYFQKILAKEEPEETETNVKIESDASRNLVPRLIELFESGPGNRGETWWDAYNAWTQFTTQIRGRTVDARLDAMFTGTTAQQNLLAMGFGLAMLQGKNIENVSSKDAKKLALAV